MEIKFDLFYIFLAICYLIDFGETKPKSSSSLSDDEDEKSVKSRKHKWTLDEEVKLIFFDVSTDTGKRNHFDRIKKEWRKVYPKSNVTDYGLRDKLRRLRQESMKADELKKKFKWSPELELELLDVHYRTRPYMKDANISIEEEWKRRHPDYQSSAKYLLWRVAKLNEKNKHLRNKAAGPSGAASYDEIGETKVKRRHKWTEDENATLLHFHRLTDTGKTKHFDRVRLMWRKEFPESEKTDKALLTAFGRLRKVSRKGGERRKFLGWTPVEEKILLDTYLHTYPFDENANQSFEEAWKQRAESSAVPTRYTVQRALRILKENKYPEYTARAMLMMKNRSNKRYGPKFSDLRRNKSGVSRGRSSRKLGEEPQAESSKSRRREKKKYQPKIESLNEGVEAGKQTGKAPIVYDSDDSVSSSPTIMPADSE